MTPSLTTAAVRRLVEALLTDIIINNHQTKHTIHQILYRHVPANNNLKDQLSALSRATFKKESKEKDRPITWIQYIVED